MLIVDLVSMHETEDDLYCSSPKNARRSSESASGCSSGMKCPDSAIGPPYTSVATWFIMSTRNVTGPLVPYRPSTGISRLVFAYCLFCSTSVENAR